MKLRKLFTGYTMFPLILIAGIGILCFVILGIGRFTNDFSAKEGSLRFELGISLGFYGSCLSLLLVFVSFIYIGICLSHEKPLAASLTLAACLLLYFGSGYANFGYMQTRSNPERWSGDDWPLGIHHSDTHQLHNKPELGNPLPAQ